MDGSGDRESFAVGVRAQRVRVCRALPEELSNSWASQSWHFLGRCGIVLDQRVVRELVLIPGAYLRWLRRCGGNEV